MKLPARRADVLAYNIDIAQTATPQFHEFREQLDRPVNMEGLVSFEFTDSYAVVVPEYESLDGTVHPSERFDIAKSEGGIYSFRANKKDVIVGLSNFMEFFGDKRYDDTRKILFSVLSKDGTGFTAQAKDPAFQIGPMRFERYEYEVNWVHVPPSNSIDTEDVVEKPDFSCQFCGRAYRKGGHYLTQHESTCPRRPAADCDDANGDDDSKNKKGHECKVCGKEYAYRKACENHEAVCGGASEEEEADAVAIACERSSSCDKSNKHRGLCNKKLDIAAIPVATTAPIQDSSHTSDGDKVEEAEVGSPEMSSSEEDLFELAESAKEHARSEHQKALNDDFGRRFDIAREGIEPYSIDNLQIETRTAVAAPNFSALEKAISEFSQAESAAIAANVALTVAKDNARAEISKLRGDHLPPAKRPRVS